MYVGETSHLGATRNTVPALQFVHADFLLHRPSFRNSFQVHPWQEIETLAVLPLQ